MKIKIIPSVHFHWTEGGYLCTIIYLNSEIMNTFIMMWNPAVSNVKMVEFEKMILHFYDLEFNWAVIDYKKAKVGDRFFMVRCGEGNTGIVMSGFLDSKPYKGDDWSGKGREVYYVKMELGCIVHPDHEPILTTVELAKEMPNFDWNGGHSGRLLDKLYAGKLELMWEAYINKNQETFNKGEAELEKWLEEDSDKIIADYLAKKHGQTCEVCGFNYKKVYGKDCKESIDYIRLDTTDYHSAEDIERTYHALCPNCQRIIKTEKELAKYKGTIVHKK